MLRKSRTRCFLFLMFIVLRVMARPAFLYASAIEFSEPSRTTMVSHSSPTVASSLIQASVKAFHEGQHGFMDQDGASRFFLLNYFSVKPSVVDHDFQRFLLPVLMLLPTALTHPPI